MPLFTGVVGDLAGFFFEDTLRKEDEVLLMLGTRVCSACKGSGSVLELNWRGE